MGVFAASGCRQKPADQTQEPLTHNAFTDNIDRGVNTMHRAESAVTDTNAQVQTQVQQADSVDSTTQP